MLLALYFENVRNAKRFLFFPNFACFCFHLRFLSVLFLFHFCAFFIITTIFVVVVTFAASDIFAGALKSLANKTNNCK